MPTKTGSYWTYGHRTPLRPGHTFETYRNGYGYQQLRAGLLGPAQMAAVGDWWLANQHSLTYAAHRILVAVDTGSSLDRLAADLQLDRADLDRHGQYGQALHTLVARDLLAIDTAGRYTPTPQVDALLRPDDRAHATHQLRWFTDLLHTGQPLGSEPTAGAVESGINKQRRQRDVIRQLEHLTGQKVHLQPQPEPTRCGLTAAKHKPRLRCARWVLPPAAYSPIFESAGLPPSTARIAWTSRRITVHAPWPVAV